MEPENGQQNINVNPSGDNGGTGALVGSIIVIILIVLAGIYFLTSNKDDVDAEPNTDDTEQMDEDVDNTDVDVNVDLDEVDAELDASTSTAN